ncbi:hypothetical protein [Halomonas qaidamensis]
MTYRVKLAVALKNYMDEHSLTQFRIAKALGVSQSLISRVLRQEWTRKTESIRKIENLLDMQPEVDPRQSEVLMNALAEVWTGDERDAELLANCIIAIGKIRKENF